MASKGDMDATGDQNSPRRDAMPSELDNSRLSGAGTREDKMTSGGDHHKQRLESPTAVPISNTNYPVVFFDLETTGLGAQCHITQIAAVRAEGTFARYVRPKIPIDAGATKVTGITCVEGQVYFQDELVECVSVTDALASFVEFLGEGPVILAGHNICKFDCPILVRAAGQCDLLKQLQSPIAGFMDTLLMFRAAYKGLESYTQEFLYKHFIGGNYGAHNALDDVIALRQLFEKSSPANIQPFTFDLQYVLDVIDYRKQKRHDMASWWPLINQSYISKFMAEKAACSGLTVPAVQEAYRLGGQAAVRELLSEKHITENVNVVVKVIEYFAQM